MMSADHFAEEMEVAEKAATEAGKIIMALYGKDYRIEQKSKNNPVTAADLEANRKIHEIILGRYPEDGWLSEENKDNPKRLAVSRVWVIDPIDGTKEFIEGIPQFAVSIALVEDGRAVVGVVYNPVEEEFYRAAKGAGATLNGRSIRVSSREKAEGASLLTSRSEPRGKFESFAAICRLKAVGSIAYRLALIAAGRGDGTLTFRSIHEWDICAGVVMVEEAGGLVMNGSGKRMMFNQKDAVCHGMIASNEVLTPVLQVMWAEAMSQGK
jgi:myo-inositol-1(or 4)-monophosphatase